MPVHDVCILIALQISNLAWLRPPGQMEATKMAKSDHDKRREILLELLYWVFDSFLIPLIRSNFHVTESNVHRNRLFYFRHDVWRMLVEPSLSKLRLNLFEDVPTEKATKLLSARPLGYSNIRLLPKKAGVRLITNLRRKQQIVRYGKTVLGRSINSVMAPAFNVITYEKVSRCAGENLCLSRSANHSSHSILRDSGRHCSPSVTCFLNWLLLGSHCQTEGSRIALCTLQKSMCSHVLTQSHSNACSRW